MINTGIYEPKNVEKCKSSKVNYKSSYQLKMFYWLDMNEHCLSWTNKCRSVEYFDGFVSRKTTPNVEALIETIDGPVEHIILIKPSNKLGENAMRIKALKEYADKLGKSFVVITEKDLG